MENTQTLSYKIENFEGPLDLLLQLIARNKLNIYDIKLSVLIDQYLEQMELFRQNDMDISSEFLEMASRLIYMKTVSLLPRHDEIEKLTQELTGELLEYQVCREMAAKLGTMTSGFDTFIRKPTEYDFDKTYELVHSSEVMYTCYLAAVGRGQRRLPPSVAPFTKIVAKRDKFILSIKNTDYTKQGRCKRSKSYGLRLLCLTCGGQEEPLIYRYQSIF